MFALPSSPFSAVFSRPSFSRPRARRRVHVPATESFILAAVCLLDLATTLFWVAYRNASEGNPIMAYYLKNGGTQSFVLVKLVLLIMPLLIAEWARLSRPRFVKIALRVGIGAYLGLYGAGVLQINADSDEIPPPVLPARHAARALVHATTDIPLRSGWNPSACTANVSDGPRYAANNLLPNEE